MTCCLWGISEFPECTTSRRLWPGSHFVKVTEINDTGNVCLAWLTYTSNTSRAQYYIGCITGLSDLQPMRWSTSHRICAINYDLFCCDYIVIQQIILNHLSIFVRDLLLQIRINLAWISTYIHYKVWDEITSSFPNFNVQPLKFGNGWVISSHTLLGVWTLVQAAIKVNPY